MLIFVVFNKSEYLKRIQRLVVLGFPGFFNDDYTWIHEALFFPRTETEIKQNKKKMTNTDQEMLIIFCVNHKVGNCPKSIKLLISLI